MEAYIRVSFNLRLSTSPFASIDWDKSEIESSLLATYAFHLALMSEVETSKQSNHNGKHFGMLQVHSDMDRFYGFAI